MHAQPNCTVAQILFTTPPRVNFARLVADLDAAFSTCPAEGRNLQWDHDDIAVLDIQASRIVLGFNLDLTGDHKACMTIGVGHGPGKGEPGIAHRQDAVSRMIVDRIAQRYRPDAMIWHHSSKPLAPDLFDALIDELPVQSSDAMARDLVRRTQMAQVRGRLKTRQAAAPIALDVPTIAANDMPDLPQLKSEELARVRAALYADQEQPTSTALRLAAHAMNATLVCIALPVGAAMMTYSLLRGENLTASARLLAIIGIAIGVRESGVAQDVLPFF